MAIPSAYTCDSIVLAVSAQINRKLGVTILAALVVVGGWLRFTAIGFGLPDKFRPDEDNVVLRALDFEKGWNPHFAIYPAAQLYLLHAVLRSYATLTGSRTDLQAAYTPNRGALAFLIGRQVSAAMGTATIAVAYWAAEPAFGPTAALASAAILAVAPVHVRESKFAKMQVPSGLWLVLAIGMMLRMPRRGRGSDYALAGFFSGLAAATHYQAVLIVLGVLAAHLEVRHRENRPLMTALADARIYVAGLAAVLTFFCATPYVVLDPAQDVRDYEFTKAFGLFAARGWYLLFRVMADSLGMVLLIFLLLAVVWVVFSSRLGTPGLLALTAVNLLSLAVSPYIMYRYAINPLLVMALLGGIFAADLIELAPNWLGNRYGRSLAVSLFALLMAPSLISDLQLDRLLLQPDTRILARRWILSHVSPPAVIAATDYVPFWNSFGEPQLPATYEFVPMRSLDLLRAEGIRWVFSDSLPGLARYSPGPSAAEQSSLDYEARLMLDINPISDGAPMPAFDPNDAFYVPSQHISSMRWPGPRIRIWMLNGPE